MPLAEVQLSKTVSGDCPGDTISLSCSIMSGSENIQLTWTFTLPGMQQSRSFNVNTTSPPLSISDIGVAVSANYTRGVGLFSIVTFTVLRDTSLNGTEIECSNGNLSRTETLFVSTAGIVMLL